MSVKVGFISLGCSKNLCDTENMMGIVIEFDFEITPFMEEADVCVVNTCGFIDSAKEESIETILKAAEYKKEKCKLLVATGCLVQRYYDEIKKELPEVDILLGTTAFSNIAMVIKEGLKGRKTDYISDKNADIPENLPRLISTSGFSVFLRIAEGCDNKCTYCAIPNIRGRYRSRFIEYIMEEAEELSEKGAKEIILIAQDTTRYGIDIYGKKMLPVLLHKLCGIDKLKWIRVHYSYPEEIDDELIETFASEAKIVKYMDIPVQHGSDSVLKRMGRRTTGRQIEELIKKIREKIPSVTIRTSIITGFPGETEEEFDKLCTFLKKVRFDRVGAFAYSCEEGTPAAKLVPQIPDDVKEKRRGKVMEISQKISFERNKNMLGKTVTVMTEGFEDNFYYGRSEGESAEVDPKIYFAAHRDLSCGDFVNVTIKDFDEYDLYGEEE